MDRLELRTKFASLVEPFRLDEYDMNLHVRKLSALERAKFAEACRVSDRSRDADNMLEVVTKSVSAFVVSRGLVNEDGSRIYRDDELEQITEEFPADALDTIAEKILVISKLKKPVDEEIKNSETVPSDSSSSV